MKKHVKFDLRMTEVGIEANHARWIVLEPIKACSFVLICAKIISDIMIIPII